MNTGIESLALPEGRLLLDFAPWALLGGGGNVGTIRWTVAAGHEDDDVTFSVREAYFTAGNDVPIGTAVEPGPLLSARPEPGR